MTATSAWYFAYGSNMDRTAMASRCPTARAVGTAALGGWRFIIMRDGYASVVPDPASRVQGVLWRITPHDRAALDAYESLATGLYAARWLRVTRAGRSVSALVYVGHSPVSGRPLPGYLDAVLAAGRDWGLPPRYLDGLARLAVARDGSVPTAGGTP